MALERLGGRTATRILKPLVFVVCLLPLAWLVYGLFTGRYTNPAEELELETGKWTLKLLAITLAITPMRQLSGMNWLVKYRRMLGLFVFFYAIIHMSCYVVFDQYFAWGEIGKDILERKYITMGMLALLTLIPLAITSTKGWIRRLGGKRWNKLHRLIYVTAVAGTIHYFWSVKKDTFWPFVYLTVFAVLLGYRLVRWRMDAAKAGVKSGGGAGAPEVRARPKRERVSA
jgi:methionine sulfoxide reductase heme-binding subunit